MSGGRGADQRVDQAFYGYTEHGVGLLAASSRERIARWDPVLKDRVWVTEGEQHGYLYLWLDTATGPEAAVVRKVRVADEHGRASTFAQALMGPGLTPQVAAGLTRWPGWTDPADGVGARVAASGPSGVSGLSLSGLEVAAEEGLARLWDELLGDPRAESFLTELVAAVMALPDAQLTVFRSAGLPVEPLLGALVRLLGRAGRRPWTFATCEQDAMGDHQPRIVFTTTGTSPQQRAKLVLDPDARQGHNGLYYPSEQALDLARRLVTFYRNDPALARTAPPSLGTLDDFAGWVESIRAERPKSLLRKQRSRLTEEEEHELRSSLHTVGQWLPTLSDEDLAGLVREWSGGPGDERSPDVGRLVRAVAVHRAVTTASPPDGVLVRAVRHAVPLAELAEVGQRTLAEMAQGHGVPRLSDLLRTAAALGLPLGRFQDGATALHGLLDTLRPVPSQLLDAAATAEQLAAHGELAREILGCVDGRPVDPDERWRLVELLCAEHLSLPLTGRLGWAAPERVRLAGRLMRSALGAQPGSDAVDRLLGAAPRDGDGQRLAHRAMAMAAAGLEARYEALVLRMAWEAEFRPELSELLPLDHGSGVAVRDPVGGPGDVPWPGAEPHGWSAAAFSNHGGADGAAAYGAEQEFAPQPHAETPRSRWSRMRPDGRSVSDGRSDPLPPAAEPPRRGWRRERGSRGQRRGSDGHDREERHQLAIATGVVGSAVLAIAAVLWFGGVFSGGQPPAAPTRSPSVVPTTAPTVPPAQVIPPAGATSIVPTVAPTGVVHLPLRTAPPPSFSRSASPH